MSDELARLDAVSLADLIRRGEATPLEVVDATIARIETLDPALNAVIHRRFEQARAEAQSDDLPDGPFRGVPFLLKDLWATSAGDPFHMGVRGFKDAGYTHPDDSYLVQRYREAGLIIVGRTNTPELGLVATTEPLAYGPTRNPWNPDFGAGGSSGGAAAAVAAGMVPAANASDGGGSIRIPAAMCGLVGLKPSRGRMSMGPLQDEWGFSCQHVVSHTVRDTAALLDISAEPFPSDGVVAPQSGQPYAGQVGADPGSLRIGFMDDHVRADVHPDCAAAVEASAALLESLGHQVTRSNPAVLDDPDAQASFSALWLVGATNTLRVLGDMLGRELTEADVEPATWAMAEAGRNFSGADVLAAQGELHRYRREMVGWWSGGFDILVTPTTAQPPPRIGDLTGTDDDPMRGFAGSIPYAVFTSAFNATGLPGISLPLGRSAGLPVGVQFVAPYGRDDLLISLASQIETAAPWAHERAPMHP